MTFIDFSDEELDHIYQAFKWHVIGETKKKFTTFGCPLCSDIVSKIKKVTK